MLSLPFPLHDANSSAGEENLGDLPEWNLDDLYSGDELAYFSAVPTALELTDEQVDRLIAAGRALLRANPQYQQLLADLGAGKPAE